MTTAELTAALPNGFDASVWGNVDNQTSPYLLSDPGPFYIGSDSTHLFQPIVDVQQLQAINDGLAGDYALIDDIDASATAGFVSLGTDGSGTIENGGNGFTGIFDGLGHTITGLTVDIGSNDYAGLFGYSSGTLRDVGLVGGSVGGGDEVGELAGENDGTISDVYATGDVTGTTGDSAVGGLVGQNIGTIGSSHATGTVSGTYAVGGLVGDNYTGTITNAYATGAVFGGASGGDIGGLAGENGSTITDVYATGAVSGGRSSHKVGGLIGWAVSGRIANAYATGAVSGGTGSFDIGGLVGDNDSYGSVNNAYATGTVTDGSGSYDVGGLVGMDEPSSSVSNAYAVGAVIGQDNVGGLVGKNDSSGTISDAYATGVVSGGASGSAIGGLAGGNLGTIKSSYATGAVSGGSAVGGLVGRNFGTVSDAYWDTLTSGTTTSAGGTGLTTSQLQDTQSFMARAGGWDFETVWAPPESGHYPVLFALSPVERVDAGIPARTTITYGDAIPGLSETTYGGPGSYVFGSDGDTLTAPALAAGSDLNAGSHSLAGPQTGTSADGVSYRFVYTNNLVQVNPASISVTALGGSSTYGDDPSNPGLSATGLQYGQDASVLTGLYNSFGFAATTDAGSYALWVDGTLTNPNYRVRQVSDGTWTVMPRPITITANDRSRVYGDANPALTYSVGGSGLVNGDTLSGSLATSAAVTSDTGNYAITQGTLTGSGNYDVTGFTPGTLMVTPRPLTVTPEAVSRIYGDADPETGAATGDNLVNGDAISSVSLASPATMASNIGTYDLAASDASGAGLSNYAISYATLAGGLQVTPRPITIVADDKSRIYGDANPALTWAVGGDGLVNGDTLSGTLATPATAE